MSTAALYLPRSGTTIFLPYPWEIALVQTFNADLEPGIDRPSFGDGSGDMTGEIRLVDSDTILPLKYDQWVEIDAERPRDSDSPYVGYHLRGYADIGRSLDPPLDGQVILVHREDDQVKFWTMPGFILSLTDGEGLIARSEWPTPWRKYVGLHSVIDIAQCLGTDWATPTPHLGKMRATVYAGYQLDNFLDREGSRLPSRLAIFKWWPERQEAVLIETKE